MTAFSSRPLHHVRRTKIIATIGPASEDEATLTRLIEAGVDTFRLNFSHGTLDSHAEAVRRVRRISEQLGRAVGVLQDLQGPRLRTGALSGGNPVFLETGKPLVLTTNDWPEGTADKVGINHAELPQDVRPGDRVLLADGALELEVIGSDETDIQTIVRHGGELGERKGINAPGVPLSVVSPTEKDRVDIAHGVSMGVDHIALSFVRTPEDIEATRRILTTLGAPHVPIIAKLERAESLANLDDILAVSDGVMVARGDLGVDLGVEVVPMFQKSIVHEANRVRVPVIVATQMLESMIGNRRPTRAEASDVANALLDGADAVMLSAETAIGQYAVESVRTMAHIIREVETNEEYEAVSLRAASDDPSPSPDRKIAHAVVGLLADLRAAALIVFSSDDYIPRLLSSERPRAPVISFTDSRALYRRMALLHSIEPQRGRFFEDTNELVEYMLSAALARGLVYVGEQVVVARLAPHDDLRLPSFITVLEVSTDLHLRSYGAR